MPNARSPKEPFDHGPGDGPVDRRRWANDHSDSDVAIAAGHSSELSSELGSDAARRFDEELTRFQRKRAMVYCLLILGILLPAFVLDLVLALQGEWGDTGEELITIVDPIFDGFLISIYLTFLVSFWRSAGPRARIMSLFRWLLIVVCSITVIGAMTLWSAQVSLNPNAAPWEAIFIAGSTATTMVLILHLLASIFVSLSPREAIIPLIPITAVFCALLFGWLQGPMPAKLMMLAAWPLAGLPGILWSTWRYRQFVDRFRWKWLRTQLGDIRDDLAGARRVHEALLPSPIRDGAVRMNFSYEPMRDIGGDYLFVRRRQDESVLVVLVDVAGHGVASALAANRMHVELERFLENRPDARPGAVLGMLNRYVHRTLAGQAVFASAIAIEIPAMDGMLRWASAGHPAALLLREHGKIDELLSTSTLLGVFDEHGYEPGETEIPFGSRETIVACTDGVHEAAAVDGVFFGHDRFRQIAREALVGGSDRIAPATLDAVRRYRGGEPTDDVLIVSAWRVE